MTDPYDFVLGTRPADLPDGILEEAARCVLDTLGVGVAGSVTDLSRIVRDHAASQWGGEAATLWQDGRRVSVAGAALANAMTIDALDAHDGFKPAKGHVGCGVIPAVLAMADGCDGAEFLTRVAIGYEVGTRAGIALHAHSCDYHTSGAWVALAVAAVTGRALGLDRARLREAIGIAEYHGPRSQMMRCIDHPTMVKDGSGWGAMAGVSAAHLARDGFTGAPAVTVEDASMAATWGDLGTRWRIREQYVKLYPVCRWAQPAVEAALALARDHGVDARHVARVEVATFHEARRLAAIPATTEEAQYSLPFSVAAALVRGTIGVAEVSADGLGDPAILDLARRVGITETDAFNAAFPERRFATARLHLTDGRVLTSEPMEAQGDPEARLDDGVIAAKFDRLVEPVLGSARTAALRGLVGALPEAPSVLPLARAMALP